MSSQGFLVLEENVEFRVLGFNGVNLVAWDGVQVPIAVSRAVRNMTRESGAPPGERGRVLEGRAPLAVTPLSLVIILIAVRIGIYSTSSMSCRECCFPLRSLCCSSLLLSTHIRLSKADVIVHQSTYTLGLPSPQTERITRLVPPRFDKPNPSQLGFLHTSPAEPLPENKKKKYPTFLHPGTQRNEPRGTTLRFAQNPTTIEAQCRHPGRWGGVAKG